MLVTKEKNLEYNSVFPNSTAFSVTRLVDCLERPESAMIQVQLLTEVKLSDTTISCHSLKVSVTQISVLIDETF